MKFIKFILLFVITFTLVSCFEETELIKHTVTFVDQNGDIIEVIEVEEGSSVIPPSHPEIRYYDFIGWDHNLENVKSSFITQPIYDKTTKEYEMTDYNYWLKILNDKYDIDSLIMTEEEINGYNQLVVKGNMYTDVVDVLSVAKVVNKEDVSRLVNKYTKMSRYSVYDEKTNAVLDQASKDMILSNRNLNNIPDSVVVQFGIITDFAWMRSYPSNAYANSYSRDQFQETSLNVGEVVAIYHVSADGNWYYVQATNYMGWVETKYIGLCTYEDALMFETASQKLVVISDYVEIMGSHVRMGQAFPLINSAENYMIDFPTRTSNGDLELKQITLSKTDDYSVGYLDYTYDNLFKQAFKLLGITYSWGDKEKLGRDCSSTQNSIYSCFGFKLPRNTGNQNDIPSYGKSFSSISIGSLKQNYMPGTLIFSSGHVMMYIGEDVHGVSYILHNTSAGDGKCILQSVSDYGINKIIGTLKLQ